MVPAVFSKETSQAAENIPTTPPGRIAPPNNRQPENNDRAAAALPSISAAPNTFAIGDSMGRERIHFQPSATRKKGRRKEARPKACRSRSARWEPMDPVRFPGETRPVAVFQEGSEG